MASFTRADDKKRVTKDNCKSQQRDGSTGMGPFTKLHFNHVKGKLRSFINLQQQVQRDEMGVADPPHGQQKLHRNFIERDAGLKTSPFYYTPGQPKKKLLHVRAHASTRIESSHVDSAAQRPGRVTPHSDGKSSYHGLAIHPGLTTPQPARRV